MELGRVQTPMHYVKIFFRRKWLLIVPAVLGVIVGIITGAFLPKVYSSRSVVMIKEEKTLNPLIQGLAISSSVGSRLKTLREQILGWNSLVKLVERLELAKDIKSQKEFEKYILSLRNKISVRMRGASNIVQISYQDKDPRKTKKIVEAINNIFIEENLRSQTEESDIAIDFIKDQLKVYRKKMKEAELAEIKESLDDLLIDSTEAHPLVKDYRKKIAQLEVEINKQEIDESELLKPVGDGTYEDIKEEIAQAIENELAVVGVQPQERVDSLNPTITNTDDRLYKLLLMDKIDATTPEDAKVNEKIYNMLLQRLETAKITKRLEASKEGTRYIILEPPRLPLDPIKPNKLLVMFLGLFMGTGLGIGLVLLFEFTDHSFLGIDEAKEFLDLPVIGGISRILTQEDITREKSRQRLRVTAFTLASILLIVLSSLYSLMYKP